MVAMRISKLSIVLHSDPPKLWLQYFKGLATKLSALYMLYRSIFPTGFFQMFPDWMPPRWHTQFCGSLNYMHWRWYHIKWVISWISTHITVPSSQVECLNGNFQVNAIKHQICNFSFVYYCYYCNGLWCIPHHHQ